MIRDDMVTAMVALLRVHAVEESHAIQALRIHEYVDRRPHDRVEWAIHHLWAAATPEEIEAAEAEWAAE